MRSAKGFGLAALIAAAFVIMSPPVPAQTLGYYSINGQVLADDWQLYLFNMGVPPGPYRMDAYGNLIADGYSPAAPVYGESDWSGQASGDWNVISPQADYWVGGDGSGCIYTPDWSNC